jgi:hypothetical protein
MRSRLPETCLVSATRKSDIPSAEAESCAAAACLALIGSSPILFRSCSASCRPSRPGVLQGSFSSQFSFDPRGKIDVRLLWNWQTGLERSVVPGRRKCRRSTKWSRANNVTEGSLRKKLTLLHLPSFQVLAFRMEWHSFSPSSPARLKSSGFSTCKIARLNPSGMCTSKIKEFKLPVMNTCKKMGEGVALFVRGLASCSVTMRGIFEGIGNLNGQRYR